MAAKAGARGRARVGGASGKTLGARGWTFNEGGVGGGTWDATTLEDVAGRVGFNLPQLTGSVNIVADSLTDISDPTINIKYGVYLELELFEDKTTEAPHHIPRAAITRVGRGAATEGGIMYPVDWVSDGPYTIGGGAAAGP
jgi:hypothetical protein